MVKGRWSRGEERGAGRGREDEKEKVEKRGRQSGECKRREEKVKEVGRRGRGSKEGREERT